jgi:hypothetical protein
VSELVLVGGAVRSGVLDRRVLVEPAARVLAEMAFLENAGVADAGR